MMSEGTKIAVADLYAMGFNPEDIAEALELDEFEVMVFCAELSEEEQ